MDLILFNLEIATETGVHRQQVACRLIPGGTPPGKGVTHSQLVPGTGESHGLRSPH